MIERLLLPRLLDLAIRYAILTLTGPRQSGTTTLCRMTFPDLPHVSLENPSDRELGIEDPMAFFGHYGDGAEAQLLRPTPLVAMVSRARQEGVVSDPLAPGHQSPAHGHVTI